VNPNNNKKKTNAMRIFDFSFSTKTDVCYIYHSLIISSLKRYFSFYLTKWWTHLTKKNSRREGRVNFYYAFREKKNQQKTLKIATRLLSYSSFFVSMLSLLWIKKKRRREIIL